MLINSYQVDFTCL